MENIDWFGFEDKDLDFPFYRKNPHVPKWGWLVLFFIIPIGLLFTVIPHLHSTIIGCIVLIVPVLYFLKWDYKAIFQKPKPKDIALALALFVGYMVYAIVMSMVLEQLGIVSEGLIDTETVSLMTIVPLFFSLMGEEFIKFIPFMFFLRLCFKFSQNRKFSIILSVIIVMVFFASLHAYSFEMFIFAIFIQGLGSIFEFIGYIKTKNILISYITHLSTDLFVYLLIIFGF